MKDLFKPKALLSAPCGLWSAVKFPRPNTRNLRYDNLSDQFRLRDTIPPEETTDFIGRGLFWGLRGKKKKKIPPFEPFDVLEARLEIMMPLIVDEAMRRLGPGLVIKTLGQLEEEGEDEERNNVLVVGILRKHHVMEPSVLIDQELQYNFDFEPGHTNYIIEPDALFLEDRSSSLVLDGFCLEPGELVSGLVVGCWGSMGEGEFWVEQLVYSRVFGGSSEGEVGAGTERLEIKKAGAEGTEKQKKGTETGKKDRKGAETEGIEKKKTGTDRKEKKEAETDTERSAASGKIEKKNTGTGKKERKGAETGKKVKKGTETVKKEKKKAETGKTEEKKTGTGRREEKGVEADTERSAATGKKERKNTGTGRRERKGAETDSEKKAATRKKKRKRAGTRSKERKGVRPVSICVISGLELAGEDTAWLGSAQLAASWLAGCAGSPGDQSQVSDTERLIIAGNSLGRSDTIYEEPERDKYRSLPSTDRALAGVRQLDDLLLEVVTTLNTDLMVGPDDPNSSYLPQQPLHKNYLRYAGLFPTLNTVTNPYTFSLAGRIITTVAGQTITDVMRYSSIRNPLLAMEKCLMWGHLAPASPSNICSRVTNDPDTEAKMDPLVLLTMPDIFIAGNQPGYQASKVHIHGHPVLLLAVPRFSQTESLVRINLETLKTRLVRFNADPD